MSSVTVPTTTASLSSWNVQKTSDQLQDSKCKCEYQTLQKSILLYVRAELTQLGLKHVSIMPWCKNLKTLRVRVDTFPFMYLTRRDMDRGGRLVLLMNKRFNTTPLNGLSVLLTKNRYSCNPHCQIPSSNAIIFKFTEILESQETLTAAVR